MAEPIRELVTVTVDGREITAPEGQMLHDAAKSGDVEIPVFCYEPKLGEPVGACRMCLVEIEGIPELQTSCSTPIRDGMVVHTKTDQVKQAQNAVVEFLLVNHPLDCPVCDKGGECPLQDISMGWGPGKSRFTDVKRHFQKPIELSPLIALDRERCILCYRCVRFSQEVAEDEQLQLLERGDRTFVGTFDDRPYDDPYHGNVIELCPVGALTTYTYRFRARPWDIEDAGSVCTLCSSQCNVKFSIRDEEVLRVLARDNEDVDDGWLCDKGRFGFQSFRSDERITQPMLRGGDGTLSPISWDDALSRVAKALESSGEKTAVLAGGGTSNEEGWLLGRILREGLGGNAIDSGAHPADAKSVRHLSNPALTARLRDIDHAGAVLVLGADPRNEMPICDLRVRKGVRRNGVRLAVATDSPTALDRRAHAVGRYLPGAAAEFISQLAGEIRSEGAASGPEAETVSAVATELRGAEDVVVVWGEELWSEPGAIPALMELAAALSIEGTETSGLIEIPSEANGRGLREVGCLPGASAGLAEAPEGPGVAEICEKLRDGSLETILLADSDPARTHPDGEGWKQALGNAFVIAISSFETPSASLANLVIPAENFSEKEGTITHPEGRLQRVRRNVPPPDGLLPTWNFLAALATELGVDCGFTDQPGLFTAMTSWNGLYQGITEEDLAGQGVRWQDREGAAGRVPAGGASPQMAAPTSTPGSAGAPDSIRLGTRRDLWAAEVAERSPALEFLVPTQSLEISIPDAERLGLEQGQAVEVSADDGVSVEAKVAIREAMIPGAAFLICGARDGNGNLLTGAVPGSRTIRIEVATPVGQPEGA
ncbi:MAG: NADH-quinone oxidoreductase subunit NuoG [bacterium]